MPYRVLNLRLKRLLCPVHVRFFDFWHGVFHEVEGWSMPCAVVQRMGSTSTRSRHRPLAEAAEVFENLIAPFRGIGGLDGQAVSNVLVPARVNFAGK